MNLSTVKPAVAQDVFVAPSAAVIGDVSLGTKASVWYGCVLKGMFGTISACTSKVLRFTINDEQWKQT